MKPAGAGAVMADHAPDVVKTDDPLTALYRKLEYFPTPPWAARAGGELIRRLDPQASCAWEPACGTISTSSSRPTFHQHGSYFQALDAVDFLSPAADDLFDVDWIVTNPPFKPAGQFVELGLRRARRGVAIFARSGWLETLGRYPLFYGERPLTVEAPFFERVPLALGSWDPNGSTATPYSWFLFMKPEATPPAIAALREAFPISSITLPIGPGTERRLTHRDDARLFGRRASMPLFDGGGDG